MIAAISRWAPWDLRRGTSEQAIKNILHRIFAQLGVSNRVELTVLALRERVEDVLFTLPSREEENPHA